MIADAVSTSLCLPRRPSTRLGSEAAATSRATMLTGKGGRAKRGRDWRCWISAVAKISRRRGAVPVELSHGGLGVTSDGKTSMRGGAVTLIRRGLGIINK